MNFITSKAISMSLKKMYARNKKERSLDRSKKRNLKILNSDTFNTYSLDTTHYYDFPEFCKGCKTSDCIVRYTCGIECGVVKCSIKSCTGVNFWRSDNRECIDHFLDIRKRMNKIKKINEENFIECIANIIFEYASPNDF